MAQGSEQKGGYKDFKPGKPEIYCENLSPRNIRAAIPTMLLNRLLEHSDKSKICAALTHQTSNALETQPLP